MESELQKKQLLLAADEMPLLRECAFFKSEDGFVHPNRVLDFDVLIYVVSGSVQVVEDDQRNIVFRQENYYFLNMVVIIMERREIHL